MEGEKQSVTFEELRPGMKLETLGCRWEVLGMPRLSHMHPQWGQVMKVRAQATLKDATAYTKEVDLEGYEHDEMEVTL